MPTARVPYLVATTPPAGAAGVSNTVTLDFQIQVDVAPAVDSSAINLWLNSTALVLSGVVVANPLEYNVSLTPVGLGYQVSVDPTFTLSSGTYCVYSTASTLAPVVTGHDYFEFSVGASSTLNTALLAKTPLLCAYDLSPDPLFSTAQDTSQDRVLSRLSSPTAYWGVRGAIPGDIIRIGPGDSSGNFLIGSLQGPDVFLQERPRNTTFYTGTVDISIGSTSLVGSGTRFLSELSPGRSIRISGSPTFYEITSVQDNENATLVNPWAGPSPVVGGSFQGPYVATELFRGKKFSTENSCRFVHNSAIRYPLLKVWGDTEVRYLAGYPSVAPFPVNFQQQQDVVLTSRVDVGNVGILDDLSVHPPATVSVAKQKFFAFSISSYSVTGGTYDRYAIPFAAISPVNPGARTLFQFSLSSMAIHSEIWIGTGTNTGAPGSDGSNRSGVRIKRSGQNTVQCSLQHGTATSAMEDVGVSYSNWVDRLWLGEIEITASGSATFKLFAFDQDLTTPVFTQSVTGGGTTNASNFSVTSLGNGTALTGARAIGNIYYVDFEPNPAGAGPYVPFALLGNVTSGDAKFRPYANVLHVSLAQSQGLNLLSSSAHWSTSGPNSNTVDARHVLDTEATFASIDSITPETLVEVLSVEDPTTADPSNPNYNGYRRANYVYETSNKLSGIFWLARTGGASGNLLSVEIQKPGPLSSLSVSQVGNNLLVVLATDSGGLVTSTVQQIVSAVESSTSFLLNAVPMGDTSELMDSCARVLLSGGAEYKVSENSRFNNLVVTFRSNKTGRYFLSVGDAAAFGQLGAASLYQDGTFVTSTPIFQPTDIGTMVTLSTAQNTSNLGTYRILGVVLGAEREYPTSTVILDRQDFIPEVNTFSWFVENRSYLVALGDYSRINSPQQVLVRTQDFNHLTDGTRLFNILVCSNMLLTNSLILSGDSSFTL